MASIEIVRTFKGFKCERCGYTWIPRILGRPESCPHCHSRVWDKPREERPTK